jgi:membrane-bound lytic murein transglycosylase MltF
MQRRVIRVLVPYSRTLFFEDRGTLYGTTVQAGQALETWINKTFETGRRPLVVTLTPTSRDRLVQELIAGHGDIVAGDITVTPERAKQFAFTRPLLTRVREVLVTSTTAPRLQNAEALSGTSVAARQGTSVYDNLLTLNEHLKAAAKPPVMIELVPATLETEDMMEMVAASLLPAVIADDWIVGLWTKLIPKLTAQSQVVLQDNIDIAWAVRPNNPRLLEVLSQAIEQLGGNSVQIGRRTEVYLSKLKQIHAATSGADVQQFAALQQMFQHYGKESGFDELLLQAQSYQESRLNQHAHSAAGAIGLMQLEPTTGAAMKVGDIRQAEPNVHAGAKYMRQLVDRYFPDAKFDEQNRTLFAFASYNTGPNAIARMRKLAIAQQLNGDVWFNNVELVTAAKIGQEPVRYVRNIYKYYVAYKLLLDRQKAAEAARRGAANAP